MKFIHPKHMRAFALVVMVAIAGFGLRAHAQATSATLNGVVSDSGGAAIPGAQVEVSNINTGVEVTVETNATGVYSATQLPPGQYTATAQKTGFRRSVQTGIVLTVGQVATVNIALPVGDVAETVTVTADEELINVTTADIGLTMNSESVSELPLNGRDPSALVFLAPGVASITRMDGNKVATTQGTNSLNTTNSGLLEWAPSSGGGRQGSIYFSLDGTTNMDAYLLTGLPMPNSDATQEFRVVTNGFDAQYGFSPNGFVIVQTKSGANAFHGGAFEAIRNNDLNAAQYYGRSVNGLKRNQFGGYVGGPIFRNKLFFFANVQDTLTNSQSNNSSAEYPTAAMIGGDFSALSQCSYNNTNNCLGYNAFTPAAAQSMAWQTSATSTYAAGSPYVGGGPNGSATPIGGGFGANFKINPTNLDAQVLKLAANNFPTLTPCATHGPNQQGCQDPVDGTIFFSDPPSTTKYIENTDRIDWTINDKQRLFIRSYILYLTDVGGSVPGNLLALVDGQTGELYNETLGHTWMINDSTVNSFTAGWLQENTLAVQGNKQKDGTNFCFSEYMKISDPAGECYLTLYQFGNGSNGTWSEPISQRRTTWSLTDSLAKTAGNLTLTAGLDLHKQYSEEDTTYPANALVWGGNGYTGNGMADLLLGQTNGIEQGGGEVVPLKGWQFGLFAQAQYKVRPDLTASFGVRWDPDTPPGMVNNYGAVFEPGAQSSKFPNAPAGILFPGDLGITNALMPNHPAIFEPRLGVSWVPKFLPRTAIRAGAGQYSGPIVYNYYNHAVDVAPFSPLYAPGPIFSGTRTPDGDTKNNVWAVGFDNPWASNAATGTPYSTSSQPDPFQSPNGGFASATYYPPSSINNFGSAGINIGSSFAPNFEPAITTTYSFSIEHQLPWWNVALHLAYVGSETDHTMIDADANPKSNSNSSSPNWQSNASRPFAPNFTEVDVDYSTGTANYNSLQVGVEKKISHGLQFQSNFVWSKTMDEASIGSVTVSNPYNLRYNYGVSYINIPFNWTSSFVYTTPALRTLNPIVRAVLGTWQVSSIITAQSGQPFEVFPSSSNVGEGSPHAVRVPGVPLNVRQGGRSNWLKNYFNPAAFANPGTYGFGYSGKNIMVGPPLDYADSSFSKNFLVHERYGLQIRMDMFNTTNHTSFGLPNHTINQTGSTGTGTITGGGPEPARLMQGGAKFTF